MCTYISLQIFCSYLTHICPTCIHRSLPSDYLYPLVSHFPTSRSIIFYDQLGCGRSDRPEDKKMYSIENAVQDLEELISYLKLDKFHLLGHSFGGIVAYEASKIDDKCLSLTLDSTPSNMKLSLDEVSRLENEVKCEIILESSDSDCSDSESESLESKEEMKKLVQDRLRRRNECRTDTMPESLAMAIESRGTTFEADDCVDYVACPPSSHSLPPTLLIRGEFDFVTEACIEGWRDIFLNWKTTSNSSNRVSYREEEMSNCAHYCHLEDTKGFAELIKGHCFVNDY